MSQVLTIDAPGHQHDETLAADGSLLPHWKLVTDELNSLNDDQIVHRQNEIFRQMRANGVAFSPLTEADDTQRPWNLDLTPLVIEPADWKILSEAMDQRARLKAAIFADIYGEQRLLSSGSIPPAMVFGHKGYLRDAVNPDQTLTLPSYSADVSRSPSGQWYVVDDICQYPAGCGYAVENRLVLSRTLPQLFREARVRRIASFFKMLQQQISDLATLDGRCVLLAPDTSDPHYFEFAYLAKYLGYTLVQVEDITIRDEKAYLKTVAGLQRVEVILRFIDDTGIDPMAIGQSHATGITGLFQAVKAGGVKVMNPLGTGVLNNPALNTCLSSLCRELLGEELLLQSAPTYWLGDSHQRGHVLSNLDSVLVRDVNVQGQLLDPLLMNDIELAGLHERIELAPEQYVAQERIDRSQAPGFQGTQRVKHQITLRMFLIKGSDGYNAMPGGLCLLDTVEGGRRPAFSSLVGSKDTWIIADGPVKPTTLLKQADLQPNFAMLNGELPSRVAENLFWLGRNAERCECSARLMSTVFQTLRQEEVTNDSPTLHALLKATTAATGTLPGFVGRGGSRRLQNPEKELLSLLTDQSRLGTLPSALASLESSTAAVRDRISDELLHVLNNLADTRAHLVSDAHGPLLTGDAISLQGISDHLNDTLMSLSAFAGLVHENFTHGDGWRFMMLGRRLERVASTASIVGTMLAKDRDDTLLLETLLRLFDSVMTYRSRYRNKIDAQPVLELLVLDEYNPRSLAYQLKKIEQIITGLPGRRIVARTDPLSRVATSGTSRVRLADPASLLDAKRESRQNLVKFLNVLQQLPEQMSEILTASYFAHVEAGCQLSDLTPNQRNLGDS